ncbi:MAG TPA: ferredoxin family protein [Anaerohalosphaeraceae bacterium]|nr:hypothetical protein [Phycisphaerae bacterium]HOK95406.1 ferredoxin family protein [Anaerohalosphaeraceae bacterium]HOL31280.1 ferredoxin family protein [Anaerohalosphaeraceae bacterium]HOM76092.1 ferredoxin family protein [Anaerohalosphaeraceae bacterium]HPC64792.1 ferredoxin family protein [Anaerohalosphaeraceae bacterium]
MTIVLCRCRNAGWIAEDILQSALELLKPAGRRLVCVDDLCALAAEQDPLFQQWAAKENLVVAACFERAVRALFAHAGIREQLVARFVNLRAIQTPQEAKAAVRNAIPEQGCPDALSGEPVDIQTAQSDWVPWFPVIDRQRCRNCMQCLNFCLFGVYGQVDQTVRVLRPKKCKTGCPACARVCPYAAIIFPKYDKSPINGDAVDQQQWEQASAASAESFKHRLSANIYQFLKNRAQNSPDSLSPDLRKLKDQFDIPDSIFNPPPSQSGPPERSENG